MLGKWFRVNQPEGQGEFYLLDYDPWQMKNEWSSLSDEEVDMWRALLDSFGECQGQTECVDLRMGHVVPHTAGSTDTDSADSGESGRDGY